MPSPDAFLVTCEHARSRVPPRYRPVFAGASAMLETHRGLDIGALELAQRIARTLACPLITGRVTRLLVDLNRSTHNPALFSPLARRLEPGERSVVLDRYYHPYRARVRRTLDGLLRARRRVLHLSVHTFTPVLNGKARDADVGLLYDPARPLEVRFCTRWQEAIERYGDPCLRVRRNYPYRGNSDGLTTTLRKDLPRPRYVGIELEVNQAWPMADRTSWVAVQRTIVGALRLALAVRSD